MNTITVILYCNYKHFIDILSQQDGVGMNGPLLDDQQFPRSDIDLCTVRHTRHKVTCKYVTDNNK